MSKPGVGDCDADVERELPSAAAAETSSGDRPKGLTPNETSSGAGARPKFTPNERLPVPTNPKERVGGEMQLGRLGGGFSSYGRGRGPPSGSSDYDLPSRADKADNWATGKKVLPSADLGRPGRYGSPGGGGWGRFGGESRADKVDSWVTGKKPPGGPPPSGTSTFGTRSRDSAGTEADRCSRGVVAVEHESNRERPTVVLDSCKGGIGGNVEPVNEPSPFGGARPTSAHSSRPSSAHSIGSAGLEDVVSKPKPKVNPFGEAKPQEVVFEERIQDEMKKILKWEARLNTQRPEAMMPDPQYKDILVRIRRTLSQVRVVQRPTLQIRNRHFSVRRSDLVKASCYGELSGYSLNVRGRLIVRYLLAIAQKTGRHLLVGLLIDEMLGEPKPADVEHLLKMIKDNSTCKLVYNHPCAWTPEKVNRSLSELKDYGHASIDVKKIIMKAAENVPITCFPNQKKKPWATSIDDLVDRARSQVFGKYNFVLSIQKQLQDPSKYEGGLPVVYYIQSMFAHFVEFQELPLKKKVDREEILNIVKVFFPAFIPEFIHRVIQRRIDKEHVDSLEH